MEKVYLGNIRFFSNGKIVVKFKNLCIKFLVEIVYEKLKFILWYLIDVI